MLYEFAIGTVSHTTSALAEEEGGTVSLTLTADTYTSSSLLHDSSI
jgi:hypothetical protein